MLRLPLTSVLLASLLLATDGLAVMPLVIVAVVVAYVISARFTPSPAAAPGHRRGGPAACGRCPGRPPRTRNPPGQALTPAARSAGRGRGASGKPSTRERFTRGQSGNQAHMECVMAVPVPGRAGQLPPG